MRSNRIRILVLLVWGSAIAGRAQTRTEPQPPSVSGKLSLITKSGDLKPARLAEVFLLPGGSKDSPAAQYLEALKKKADAYSKEIANRGEYSDVIDCQAVIIAKDTAHETMASLKESQFQGVRADEEGLFRFSAVEPKAYLLIAFGRAGLNEAYWQETTVVKSGENVALKLPSPLASCFMNPE